MAALLGRLLSPTLGDLAFAACAGALRLVVEAALRGGRPTARVVARVRGRIEVAWGEREVVNDPVVEAALSALGAASAAGTEVTERELARRLGVPRWELARRFRDALGVTVREWRRAVPRRQTVAALAQSAGPIKVVALEAGYRDATQFARAVRRTVGLPPRLFREVCRRVSDAHTGSPPAHNRSPDGD
ncbi:MAG: helix-turn-helix transcriptional regulator [Armatimonadota bacterium]|nr:helix-turn-helix transcriptional regulator [Armatimonadota bacterium]